LSPVLANVIVKSSPSENEIELPETYATGTLKYPDSSVLDAVILNNAKSSEFARLDTLKCPLIPEVESSIVLR